MKDLLQTFRNQIDTIDEEMVYLLYRRLEIVKQIGKIKKQANIAPLQGDRWNAIMKNIMAEAEDKRINTQLVKNIWDLIHEESLKLEK